MRANLIKASLFVICSLAWDGAALGQQLIFSKSISNVPNHFVQDLLPYRDFDGDNVRDFVVGAPSYSNGLFSGFSSCSHGSLAQIISGDSGVELLTLQNTVFGWESACFGEAIDVGKLNGDALDDIAVGGRRTDGSPQRTGWLYYYTPGPTHNLPSLFAGANRLNAIYGYGERFGADVFVAGNGDVYVSEPSGCNGVNGVGTSVQVFAYPHSSVVPNRSGCLDSTTGQIQSIGDVSGDQVDDFVVALNVGGSGAAQTEVRRINGNTFTGLGAPIVIPGVDALNVQLLRLRSDMDGDGYREFVVLDVLGTTMTIYSGASSRPLRIIQTSSGSDSSSRAFPIGDIDSDTLGDFLLWNGNTARTFSSRTGNSTSSITLPTSYGVIQRGIQLDDLNQNGTVDYIFATKNGSNLYLIGVDATAFTTPDPNPPGSGGAIWEPVRRLLED